MTVPEMLKNAIASSKIIASRKSARIGKISRLKNLWGAVAQFDSFDKNTSFDVIGNYEESSATDFVTDVTDGRKFANEHAIGM